MATVTRVNGSGLSTAGNVFSPGASAFKILVKIANGTAVDLRAEDGIRDQPRSRGLGDVYKRQVCTLTSGSVIAPSSNFIVPW